MLSLVGAELFIFKDGEEKELKALSLYAKSLMTIGGTFSSTAVLEWASPAKTSLRSFF